MGTCCSRDPTKEAGHELVPIKRHAVWPRTAKVVTNVQEHEFSTWDLTCDESNFSSLGCSDHKNGGFPPAVIQASETGRTEEDVGLLFKK
ncbi:unnamed protein product [Pleuronectes platessa]|uniref:Uncharacterized protein n=1 Tax=Pleuronectes platessa TaxID=8262 RepID=A0A9N7VB76_PLEPL|nr:unnamed protein product [Pleuronectes platessa]